MSDAAWSARRPGELFDGPRQHGVTVDAKLLGPRVDEEVQEVQHEHGARRHRGEEDADAAAEPPRTDGARGSVGEEAR
jgi:hypothetical protein